MSIRTFASGATRSTDSDKPDFEAFLSPLALREFANYMCEHRIGPDGKLRPGDNWQKGIPKDSYMKSAWRHFFDVWACHRGNNTAESQVTNLCALLFNIQGYLHELLKETPDA